MLTSLVQSSSYSLFLKSIRPINQLTVRDVSRCMNTADQMCLKLLGRYHNVNVSVAVQTENGLMVPVVKVFLVNLGVQLATCLFKCV